ncbi:MULTISPECIES: helix-turn-helix domain-containing protein [unclassified Streptomyces]|uniref:helix-turn-helix domain-containing protein n=1 Tax=unclassified Streptomyces TaxID=2593676 RepID=UPI002DDAB021|nr:MULTISPECIES: helix-turn-helix domain-containing protein [unclassified Streptomyces]WSA91333.1 helix-turn-helix transcriptional regulator [Streptomyces sp. NBC_01795]WSS16058.1 helix-turn-helix transcriptional regulator [Streptomyces sp. NBC_01186]WSS44877.1 helix-turn-helix transcriptional regulator [Streptomyces sp. NBC_01187]
MSSELGDFLKARRRELSPAAAGLPDDGRRRVSGLRREEVALLASVSPDYYARLEQGRRRASEPVLEALARVLRLSEDERAYLFGLSGKDAGRPRRRPAQRVRPQLRQLLDDLTNTPALVLGRCTDILAWNPPATALFTDFALLPAEQRNFVRLVFCEPAVRALYADWNYMARACVAQLRMEAAHDPANPRLTALVGELSVRDADFRRWWGDHRVAMRTAGTKAMRHPVVGELALEWSTLTDAADPDQQLIALTAAPGTSSHDGLRLLASWTAAAPRVSPHPVSGSADTPGSRDQTA